jgi:membrane-associated phospholipid phosphatase
VATAVRRPQRAIERTSEAVHTVQAAAKARTVPDREALGRGRVGVAVVLVALGVFAVLFGAVRAGRSAEVDHRITVTLQRRRAPWFRRLMHAVSWPGFPPQSRVLPPLVSLTWLVLGFPLEALFQILAWGTGGLSFTFKRVMRRPRPAHPEIRVAVARIGGSSFPSGHVINYVGVYGFLAYALSTMARPAALRRAVVGGLVGLIALVGPSRIYLGHHWATDVTASYLLGTSYLIALTAVYRRVKGWLAGG